MTADRPQRLAGHPCAWVGRGAAARLTDVLDEAGAERVLVVTGATTLCRQPAAAVVDILRRGRTVACHAGVTPNPDLAQARLAAAAAREFRPDAVVGLGGGSVLDVAKVAAVFTAGVPRELATATVPARTTTLVLAPTILGSGSEMTRFATVYVEGVKRSLDHGAVRSDAALVDPALAASVPLPAGVPAALDALVQAAESYWSVCATPMSRSRARQALRRLAPALGALRTGASFADTAVQDDLAVGAALAGIAIDETRTTAAHALSYALTARRGLAHGTAVALHFRWLLGYNAEPGDCRHPGGESGLRSLLDDIDAVVRHGAGVPPDQLIVDLLRRAGQPTSLAGLALDRGTWAPLAAEALGSARARNNPRVVTADAVLAAIDAW